MIVYPEELLAARVKELEAARVKELEAARVKELEAENAALKREIAVAGDAWEQQKDLALTYLTDCNEAVVENERLRDIMDRVANQLEHAANSAMLLAGKAEQ